MGIRKGIESEAEIGAKKEAITEVKAGVKLISQTGVNMEAEKGVKSEAELETETG